MSALRCEAVTLLGTQCSRDARSGNYCWQHGENKTSPININKLPKDIFTNLGEFTELKSITNLQKTKKASFPNLLLKKECGEISNFQNGLNELYRINPDIKSLIIYPNPKPFMEDNHILDMSQIAQFKKLEYLQMWINEFNPANLSKLKNLRELYLMDIEQYRSNIKRDKVNLSEIIDSLPKLEHFHLGEISPTQASQFGSNWIAPRNLKTLELTDTYNGKLSLKHFENITRIISRNNGATYNDNLIEEIHKNIEILNNLEVLEIPITTYLRKLKTDNLKFFKLSEDGLGNSDELINWNLHNLQYLSMSYADVLLEIGDILMNSKLDNLKYLDIHFLDFDLIDNI
jgi:hypothetical protein